MQKQKKEETFVQCLECKRSALFQWDNNPIIAACQKGGRDVANLKRKCPNFIKADELPKPIKHLTHYT